MRSTLLLDVAHELGADGINLIPVHDHCGEHLSMRKEDIALFNAEIAPIIEQRAYELVGSPADYDAFPFGDVRKQFSEKIGKLRPNFG
ncbi:MAG: hypothetical protein ABIU06_12300 [Anaerolineales bacterium]